MIANQATFQANFEAWFATIQGQLSGDIAGNLAASISNLAGTGRTTQTVKGNADAIAALGSSIATSLSEIPTIDIPANTNANAITLKPIATTHLRTTTFYCRGNNNGTTTTVNSKPLLKENGAIPNLKSGRTYTIWYDSGASGGTFFLKASASGNVTADQVLASRTYSSDEDVDKVGTMVNRSYDVVGGYTNAKSVRTDGLGSLVFEPVTGYYKEGLNVNGYGTILANDPNFIAANLLAGKSAFGLVGTLNPEQYVFGIANVGYSYSAKYATNMRKYAVAGLGFTPVGFLVVQFYDQSLYQCAYLLAKNMVGMPEGQYVNNAVQPLSEVTLSYGGFAVTQDFGASSAPSGTKFLYIARKY